VSETNESAVIDSFFDIYGKYLEIQHVIELCRPYFELPNGKDLVDDLLRIAMEYGLIGERLMSEYPDILTSPEILERMGDGICELADRVASIQWPPHMRIHNSVLNNPFSDYVMSALISSTNQIHQNGFDSREWFLINRDDTPHHTELICRNKDTREWNGAHVLWENGQVRQIGLYENDSPLFIIYVYSDGMHEVVRGKPPVAIELSEELDHSDKNEQSDSGWGTVLAGTVGGLLLSSWLKNHQRHSRKDISVLKTEYKLMR
jgi:hypothetical protein